MAMKHDKRQTWWKRRQSLSAGEAATFGAAVGLAAATAAALNPPGDFSFGFLAFLLLTLGPCGGIAGYMFWLVCDPAREQWLRTITIVVGLFFHIVLFITVPSFWRDLARDGTRYGRDIHGIYLRRGRVCCRGRAWDCTFRGLCWRAMRRYTKPELGAQGAGVWDRELDPN